MKNYTYSGPPSGVTLSNGQEVLLFPGKAYALPESNAWVQAQVKLTHLTEVAPKTAAKPAKKSNKKEA